VLCMPSNKLLVPTLFNSRNTHLKTLAVCAVLFFAMDVVSQSGEAVRSAHKFNGSDAGEKITACIAALPAAGGVCDARSLTGEQRSAASIVVGSESKPVELLLGAVTLNVSKPVTLSARSSIVGLPSGSGIGTYQGPTVIKAADDSKLPAVLELSGRLAVLQDVTIDGNKSHNTGDGTGVAVRAWRADLFRVTVQNSPGPGIAIVSSKSNEACCPKLEKVISINSGKAGLLIQNTGDVFVSLSEFENNGTNGVELSSSSGLRIENSDFGGNQGSGLLLYGTASLPTAYSIIVGNQFGNNTNADIIVAGADGRKFGSLGHLISSNGFLGGGKRPNGTRSAIEITDSAYNIIANNSFFSIPGHAYAACVNLSGSRERLDQINSNYCHRAETSKAEEFIGVNDTVFNGNQGRTRKAQSGIRLPFMFWLTFTFPIF
jgi:Right handed beta helix region